MLTPKISYVYSYLGRANTAEPLATANWRPLTLRTPFLCTFITICIILLVLVELTIKSCLPPQGCPIIGEPSPTVISNTAAFVYNYLPPAITITLGLLWATVHHDYMRMEPWFQLSKEEGATVEQSLWLKYPYTFPPFVAIKAGKARHYTVMISSIVFLCISMFLTPVTSGILEESPLHKHVTREANYSYLPWLEPQMASNEKLPLGYVYIAYAYSWLNGSLPPFTTADYAVAPFTIKGNRTSYGQNETWTGETFIYEADIECEQVIRVLQVPSPDDPMYDNGQPKPVYNFTSVDGTLDYGRDMYFASLREPWIWTYGVQLANNQLPNNPSLTKREWIFSWGSRDNPGGNYSATICSPKIHMERVNATVRMPSGKVESILRLPEPYRAATRTDIQSSPWLDALFLNMSMNEAIQDVEEMNRPYGALPILFPSGEYQSDRHFGYSKGKKTAENFDPFVSTIDFGDHVGFLGLSLSDQRNDTLPDLLQWENLAERSRKIFKVIFSTMCADKRLSNHKEEAPTTVLSRFIVRGYQVNVAWGRAAQGALSFVIFSVLILLPLGWNRKCCLDGEPNALAANLALLERSPKIVEQFQHGEYHSPKSLKSKLLGNGSIYHLRHTEGEGPRIDVDTVVQLASPAEQDKPYRMREDWPTSGVSGLSFEFVFLIITALLISIYAYDCKHNGIPTIYALNSLNYKILFSYLPTVLGLVMEPFLVTLGSYHCMFGPYKMLRRGANSRRTLCLDFDKSPPHFQILRSLRSRNFTLAALCFAILLSNVFGSALSGMFSSSIAYTTYNLQGKSYGTPILLEGFAAQEFEMYSRISTELMSGLSIPSWTTSEYYLLPVSLDLPATATNISIPTLGLGASVSCTLIPDFMVTRQCMQPAPEENPSSETWVLVGQPPCNKSESSELWKYESQDSCWPQERPKGDEYQSIFKSPTCADTYFVFWREKEGDGNVAMRCKITERVAEMVVTVDSKGLVLGTKEVAQFTQREIAALYAEESRYVPSRRILPKLLNPITGPTSSSAGGVSNSWINYLMSTNYPSLSNNTDTGYFNLPDKAYVVEAFEAVFKQIYSMNIYYQASDMISVAPGSPRDVTATVTAVRDVATVSTTMFGLAIGILLYTILLLPVIYRRHSSAMLPHLPVNLAQTWTALYRSEAKFECGMVRGSNPKERARQLGELGHIYEYGTFTDADGKASYGVFCKRKDESD